jgi:hypothetical protein
MATAAIDGTSRVPLPQPFGGLKVGRPGQEPAK